MKFNILLVPRLIQFQLIQWSKVTDFEPLLVTEIDIDFNNCTTLTRNVS